MYFSSQQANLATEFVKTFKIVAEHCKLSKFMFCFYLFIGLEISSASLFMERFFFLSE